MYGSPDLSLTPVVLTIGRLTGRGSLYFYHGAGTEIGSDLEADAFEGNVSGSASAKFVKNGSQTFTLNGSSDPFEGQTEVRNGALLVNGTLAGTGLVQNVTAHGPGAWLSPGATTVSPSHGRLRVGNLTMTGSSLFRCGVGGTNAGANLDQIDASGTVTLTSANLDVATSGGGASGHDIVLTDLSALPPGSFSGIQVLPNGHVQVGGTGTPGALYDVQANANLNTTNWLLIGTALANFNGAFSFVDTNAPSFSMRFYRFLLP